MIKPWAVGAFVGIFAPCRPGRGTAEVRRAVSMANNAVSRVESVRAFRILPAEFGMANGLVTPSLKMRRAAIAKMYEADIEELYAS